jgi:Cu/Ag efflux pump CusA
MSCPAPIRVNPNYDRSLKASCHSVVDVETTLVNAFVLVVIVIFAFLGRAN